MPRLFSLPDGVLDAKDRASWLTRPFDISLYSHGQGAGAALLSKIIASGLGHSVASVWGAAGVFGVPIFIPLPDDAFAWGPYSMILAQTAISPADLSAPLQVSRYSFSGALPKEVIVRVELSTLYSAGDSVTVSVSVNGAAVLPVTVLAVASGTDHVLAVSRLLPINPGDVLTVTASAGVRDTAAGVVTTVYDSTTPVAALVAPGGAVLVDASYAATDDDPYPLAYYDADSVPIVNGTVRAYREVDYSASRRSNDYVVGQSTTDADGLWTSPMLLEPDDYVFVFFKQGAFSPSIARVNVV